ncbi:hypothetical protein ACFL4A_03570 [bacterium]
MQKNKESLVLVVGGFHVEILETLLRVRGVSYKTLSPIIDKLQDDDIYIKQIVRQAARVLGDSAGLENGEFAEHSYAVNTVPIKKGKYNFLSLASHIGKPSFNKKVVHELKKKLIKKGYAASERNSFFTELKKNVASWREKQIVDSVIDLDGIDYKEFFRRSTDGKYPDEKNKILKKFFPKIDHNLISEKRIVTIIDNFRIKYSVILENKESDQKQSNEIKQLREKLEKEYEDTLFIMTFLELCNKFVYKNNSTDENVEYIIYEFLRKIVPDLTTKLFNGAGRIKEKYKNDIKKFLFGSSREDINSVYYKLNKNANNPNCKSNFKSIARDILIGKSCDFNVYAASEEHGVKDFVQIIYQGNVQKELSETYGIKKFEKSVLYPYYKGFQDLMDRIRGLDLKLTDNDKSIPKKLIEIADLVYGQNKNLKLKQKIISLTKYQKHATSSLELKDEINYKDVVVLAKALEEVFEIEKNLYEKSTQLCLKRIRERFCEKPNEIFFFDYRDDVDQDISILDDVKGTWHDFLKKLDGVERDEQLSHEERLRAKEELLRKRSWLIALREKPVKKLKGRNKEKLKKKILEGLIKNRGGSLYQQTKKIRNIFTRDKIQDALWATFNEYEAICNTQLSTFLNYKNPENGTHWSEQVFNKVLPDKSKTRYVATRTLDYLVWQTVYENALIEEDVIPTIGSEEIMRYFFREISLQKMKGHNGNDIRENLKKQMVFWEEVERTQSLQKHPNNNFTYTMNRGKKGLYANIFYLNNIEKMDMMRFAFENGIFLEDKFYLDVSEGAGEWGRTSIRKVINHIYFIICDGEKEHENKNNEKGRKPILRRQRLQKSILRLIDPDVYKLNSKTVKTSEFIKIPNNKKVMGFLIALAVTGILGFLLFNTIPGVSLILLFNAVNPVILICIFSVLFFIFTIRIFKYYMITRPRKKMAVDPGHEGSIKHFVRTGQKKRDIPVQNYGSRDGYIAVFREVIGISLLNPKFYGFRSWAHLIPNLFKKTVVFIVVAAGFSLLFSLTGIITSVMFSICFSIFCSICFIELIKLINNNRKKNKKNPMEKFNLEQKIFLKKVMYSTLLYAFFSVMLVTALSPPIVFLPIIAIMIPLNILAAYFIFHGMFSIFYVNKVYFGKYGRKLEKYFKVSDLLGSLIFVFGLIFIFLLIGSSFSFLSFTISAALGWAIGMPLLFLYLLIKGINIYIYLKKKRKYNPVKDKQDIKKALEKYPKEIHKREGILRKALELLRTSDYISPEIYKNFKNTLDSYTEEDGYNLVNLPYEEINEDTRVSLSQGFFNLFYYEDADFNVLTVPDSTLVHYLTHELEWYALADSLKISDAEQKEVRVITILGNLLKDEYYEDQWANLINGLRKYIPSQEYNVDDTTKITLNFENIKELLTQKVYKTVADDGRKITIPGIKSKNFQYYLPSASWLRNLPYQARFEIEKWINLRSPTWYRAFHDFTIKPYVINRELLTNYYFPDKDSYSLLDEKNQEYIDKIVNRKSQYLLKVSGDSLKLNNRIEELKIQYLKMLETIYPKGIKNTIFYQRIKTIDIKLNGEFYYSSKMEERPIQVANIGQFFYTLDLLRRHNREIEVNLRTQKISPEDLPILEFFELYTNCTDVFKDKGIDDQEKQSNIIKNIFELANRDLYKKSVAEISAVLSVHKDDYGLKDFSKKDFEKLFTRKFNYVRNIGRSEIHNMVYVMYSSKKYAIAPEDENPIYDDMLVLNNLRNLSEIKSPRFQTVHYVRNEMITTYSKNTDKQIILSKGSPNEIVLFSDTDGGAHEFLALQIQLLYAYMRRKNIDVVTPSLNGSNEHNTTISKLAHLVERIGNKMINTVLGFSDTSTGEGASYNWGKIVSMKNALGYHDNRLLAEDVAEGLYSELSGRKIVYMPHLIQYKHGYEVTLQQVLKPWGKYARSTTEVLIFGSNIYRRYFSDPLIHWTKKMQKLTVSFFYPRQEIFFWVLVLGIISFTLLPLTNIFSILPIYGVIVPYLLIFIVNLPSFEAYFEKKKFWEALKGYFLSMIKGIFFFPAIEPGVYTEGVSDSARGHANFNVHGIFQEFIELDWKTVYEPFAKLLKFTVLILPIIILFLDVSVLPICIFFCIPIIGWTLGPALHSKHTKWYTKVKLVLKVYSYYLVKLPLIIINILENLFVNPLIEIIGDYKARNKYVEQNEGSSLVKMAKSFYKWYQNPKKIYLREEDYEKMGAFDPEKIIQCLINDGFIDRYSCEINFEKMPDDVDAFAVKGLPSYVSVKIYNFFIWKEIQGKKGIHLGECLNNKLIKGLKSKFIEHGVIDQDNLLNVEKLQELEILSKHGVDKIERIELKYLLNKLKKRRIKHCFKQYILFPINLIRYMVDSFDFAVKRIYKIEGADKINFYKGILLVFLPIIVIGLWIIQVFSRGWLPSQVKLFQGKFLWIRSLINNFSKKCSESFKKFPLLNGVKNLIKSFIYIGLSICILLILELTSFWLIAISFIVACVLIIGVLQFFYSVLQIGEELADIKLKKSENLMRTEVLLSQI